MKVTIRFKPPTRENSKDGLAVHGSSIHERRLEAVPRRKARQMVDDFSRYQMGEAQSDRYKIYKYAQADEEVQVALDFGEIIAIEVLDS